MELRSPGLIILAPLLHYTQRGTICACTSTIIAIPNISFHIWKDTNHLMPKYMNTTVFAPLPHYIQGGTICACTSTSLHPTRHNLCVHLYFITPNEAQFVPAPLLHYTQQGTGTIGEV